LPSAYKLAMGLPKSASNKTNWAISAQPTINAESLVSVTNLSSESFS